MIPHTHISYRIRLNEGIDSAQIVVRLARCVRALRIMRNGCLFDLNSVFWRVVPTRPHASAAATKYK